MEFTFLLSKILGTSHLSNKTMSRPPQSHETIPLNKNFRKNFRFCDKLSQEQKYFAKTFEKMKIFVKTFAKQNYFAKTFAKTKIFVKKKVFKKQNFEKCSYFRLTFAFHEKVKKKFSLQP
jgi:hypothetical protein